VGIPTYRARHCYKLEGRDHGLDDRIYFGGCFRYTPIHESVRLGQLQRSDELRQLDIQLDGPGDKRRAY